MSQANLSALLRWTDIRRFGALNNTQTGLKWVSAIGKKFAPLEILKNALDCGSREANRPV